MKAVYMGKNKRSVVEGLKHLVGRGVEVAAVVAPPRPAAAAPGDGESLADAARDLGLPVTTDMQLYAHLGGAGGPAASEYRLDDVDLVISFLFWKRIRKPLIELPRIGCVNFHPAPLPDIRGAAGYCLAIYEQMTSWGVSAHFVDESFDTGDIIKVLRFSIDPEAETAFSLEQKSQAELLKLFAQVIEEALREGSLPRTAQGEGRYFSKQDFEGLRRIRPEDTPEEVQRKIRAFWFPPYGGACVEIGGKEFTLIDDKLLAEIDRSLWRKPT